jgi:hypothetical protein
VPVAGVTSVEVKLGRFGREEPFHIFAKCHNETKMMDEITEKEISNASLYATSIKTKCVRSGCGVTIPGTWSHYQRFGNYCMECSGELSRKSRERLYPPIKRGKYGDPIATAS